MFIVLPGEAADAGVKGAIKVEWVRKGDLPEQMKRAGMERRRRRRRRLILQGRSSVDVRERSRRANCIRALIQHGNHLL